MSIRILLLVLFIAFLAVYAWRNWFFSLCGLIVLTAVMGHPDVPKTIFGIQGLNPWNILLAAIILPWFLDYRRRGKSLDMPRAAKWLFGLYLGVVIIAYLRAAMDMGSFPDRIEGGAITFSSLTSDQLINSLKYTIPGLMLFDGCRTRRRCIMGICATLGMALLYALIVIRTVPVSNLQETGKTEMRQRHRIGKTVGFHANSVAMICVAGSWGLLAASTLWKRRIIKAAFMGGAVVVLIGLALTRSRGGYIAFVVVGILFAILIWRSLLVLLPIGLAIVVIAAPGISQRTLAGVGMTDITGEESNDMDMITAGRTTDIWPPVIDQITESPIWGYGRLGILRTPAHDEVRMRMGQADCPTHPHNAYLEVLLDGGILSAGVIGLFFAHLLYAAFQLCRDKRDALFRAVGGMLLAAVGALGIMGMSGQTFFPKENTQMAWCVFGLGLRVWGDRSRQLAGCRLMPAPGRPT